MSWLRCCTGVAQRRSTKLCTMFGRLLSWYTIYIHIPSAKLRRLTEGATCIRQGGHHVGHLPTFLVLLFFPRLISAAADSMSTILLHMVWPYSANQNENVLCAARWICRTQKIAIWAPSHNFIGLYLRNFSMYRQSEKNY